MFARHQSAVAVTDQSLVAAPGANRQIKVRSVVVSNAVSTGSTITIESATTNRRLELYFAAAGTVVLPSTERGWFHCVANEALTYTSTGVGSVFITVEYEIVRTTGA